MAPKVPSFIKRSKNVEEIFKTETKEVPLNATPVNQVPGTPASQTTHSGSTKKKLAQSTLDLSATPQTRSVKKNKAVKTDPDQSPNLFKDMIDTHVPTETIAAWSKMSSIEAMHTMRFATAQSAFFALRYCDEFAVKTQYDLQLQGEIRKLKAELAASEDRAKIATAAVRKATTVETSLRNEKVQLQGQVKDLKDEKLSMLQKTNELEFQVDALNAAAEVVKSSMLATEKARYDEGYNEGINDYIRSTWEKMPNLDWSLLGEDVVGMIKDFEKKTAAPQDSVPPVPTVERSLGSDLETAEVLAPEAVQTVLPAPPPTIDESDKTLTI